MALKKCNTNCHEELSIRKNRRSFSDVPWLLEIFHGSDPHSLKCHTSSPHNPVGSFSPPPPRPPWFRGWRRTCTCMTFHTTTQKIVFHLLSNRQDFSENFCEQQTTSVSCHKINYYVSHRRVVSSAAVLCDATDFWGRASRDNTKIGCVGEYQKESDRG